MKDPARLRGGGDPEDKDGPRFNPCALADRILKDRRAGDRVAVFDSVDPVVVDHGDDAVARMTISKEWRDQ